MNVVDDARARAAARPGVNMIGYARAGLGNGETMRRFAEVAFDGGLPCALVDFDANLGERGRDLRLEHRLGNANPYSVNLFFVNADQMPVARAHFGEAFFAGRRNVALWWWELEHLPPAWHGSFALVDEVWAGSQFVHDTLARCATVPVRRVTVPVLVPPGPAFSRRRLGVPDDRFVFLFSFDFHSFIERKNPADAIEAFRRAFPASDDRARLLIKTLNGARAPHALAGLRQAIANDPRIVLFDGYLDPSDAMGVVRSCDAFLSLHRSEGFGQSIAEAMLLGKPAIATAWSGNLEFMNETNSGLVPATLVPVGADAYPYGEGQRWAQPDVAVAARLMRRFVDDPSEAQRVAAAGSRTIRERHDANACLASLKAALASMPGAAPPP